MLFDNYDKFLLSVCLWREARGQSDEAKRWIVHVILNRAKSGKKLWPATVPGVILQPWQFSSFNTDDPNSTKFPHPNQPADFKAYESCCKVVENPGTDPTGGAFYYHSLSPRDRTKWPKWASDDKLVATLSPFFFYKF